MTRPKYPELVSPMIIFLTPHFPGRLVAGIHPIRVLNCHSYNLELADFHIPCAVDMDSLVEVGS